MAYKRMESPFVVMLPVVIQTYLNSMDQLMMIFLRWLPPVDIDTLEKVFWEVVTFMKQENPNGGGNMIIPLPTNTFNVLLQYQAIP